ncbi:glycosyl hydrolase family 61-domain-containing protein [Bisporella sp. PMI_857]|nr:glycosyl hydrolase family 61-domain-containing protein [Bisporella sp. PMI_857]
MAPMLFFIAALMGMISLSQGHYSFVRIAHNGEWQHPTRYIRNKTTPYEEQFCLPGAGCTSRTYNFPTDMRDRPESIRCGRDNILHGGYTETLTVRAGDTLEFAHQRWDPEEWYDEQWYNCPYGYGSCDRRRAPPDYLMDFNHWGPLIAHLSKVPSDQDVTTYDGSGNWVKIYTQGLELRAPNDLSRPDFKWVAYNDSMLPPRSPFTIPKQTPAGDYLLRIDLPAMGFRDLYYVDGQPVILRTESQLYPSCAQIRVLNDEYQGDLPVGVKIPEAFEPDEPGMETSRDMYYGNLVDEGFQYPGGPIWDGEKLVVDKPF